MTRGAKSGWLVSWVVIGCAHAVATFIAWSGHPGNRPPSEQSSFPIVGLWKMLELPLIALLPDRFVNGNFGIVLVANSGLVAAIVIGLLRIGQWRRTHKH